MDFETLHRNAAAISDIVTKAVQLIGDPTRQGGCFSFLTAKIDICLPIGSIDPKKKAKYYALANEKVRRLEIHRGHLTSYQSRNPKASVVSITGPQPWGQWGGGIRTDNGYRIAFSGLPELWDEAVMFVAAIKLGWSDKTKTLRHISRKRNPHLRPLLEACNL